MLEPINTNSLKDEFVTRFETLILSGHFPIGEKIPPERDLARQLGISRPVVHEGLVDLVAKGLVSMKPRKGTTVNDYRKEGSLALLTTLFEFGDGMVSKSLLESLLDMRVLFEMETIKLAALQCSEKHLEEFTQLIFQEKNTDHNDTKRIVELDFMFHHLVAMASGNIIYPLLLNSLYKFYTNLTSRFFSDPAMVPTVFDFHEDLVNALIKKDEKKAVKIMGKLLSHGEKYLRIIIS